MERTTSHVDKSLTPRDFHQCVIWFDEARLYPAKVYLVWGRSTIGWLAVGHTGTGESD